MVLSRIWRLGLARNGSVAVAFGLALLPIVMLIGLAIDFGFIAQARAQLDLAADTAALTATRTAGSAFIASGSTATAVTRGQNDGIAWFNAQVGLIPNAQIMGAPTVTVTPSGNTFTTYVSYSAQVKTFFSGLFGIPYVTMSNTADATITANAYIDVTFLLDNSSSMLIASTLSGVTALESATALASSAGHVNLAAAGSGTAAALKGLQCAFACHWDPLNVDYYGVARALGVQLRFDVVQSATATAIGQMYAAQQGSGISNQFGASIFAFNSTLNQIYPASGQPTCHGSAIVGCDLNPSTDANGAQAAAANFQNPLSNDTANTYFPQAMASLAAQSTAAGDGATQATPRKALIIVTDGIQDWTNLSGGAGARTPVPGYSLTAGASANYPGGAEGPISSADCNAMKALGYDIYVLYTTYITQDASGNQNPLVIFNTFLVPYVNGVGASSSYNLATSLQACASSPANYAQASDPAAITAAMTAMLQSVINSGARLTE